MIGIVTGFLTTKSSLYITLVALIGVTGPFWHVVYGIRPTQGLFGYRFMSSFLNSLGSRLSILCAGLLILYFSQHLVKDYKKTAKFIGVMFSYVGIYFLILIVFPKKMLLNTFGIKDFHRSFYYISMAGLTVSAGFVFFFMQRTILNVERKLKNKIRILVDFIFRVKKDHYPKVASKALYSEIHEKVMKTEDSVEDNANDFEDDMYDTLEEVTKK